MRQIKKLHSFYLKHFESILYLSIFSIFLANFKAYILLFALNILFVFSFVVSGNMKIKLSKWEIAAAIFMGWSIVNTIIAYIIFKTPIDFATVIKLNLNIAFLLSMSQVIKSNEILLDKSKFINFMEFIILINFIQIVLIYALGGLFGLLFNDSLTQSSDSAYAISAYYNIIGGNNKNIWGGKFALLYIVYLYFISYDAAKIDAKRKAFYTVIGVVTTAIVLSRTALIAVILPVCFIAGNSIKHIDKKYRGIIYFMAAVVMVAAGGIVLNKFLHIKFDMTDGGYTRLYIWQEALKDMWQKHWVLGNGIGYSKFFIENRMDRIESNLHNVYLNIFFELGIVGILSYVSLIGLFVKQYIKRKNIIRIICTIIIPFIVITSLQYLGFDNDIIMLLLLLLTSSNIIRADRELAEEVNIKQYV